MQSAFLQGVTHSQLSEVETIDPLPFPVLGLSLLERKKKKKLILNCKAAKNGQRKITPQEMHQLEEKEKKPDHLHLVENNC